MLSTSARSVFKLQLCTLSARPPSASTTARLLSSQASNKIAKAQLSFTSRLHTSTASTSSVHSQLGSISHLHRRSMATITDYEQSGIPSSGVLGSVWTHTDPLKNRPKFSKLSENIETDVCIIGAGIAGISTAYELVKRGHRVVLVEAREVMSGETGRTSGHLASDLDDEFVKIKSKHGKEGAKYAAQSHDWAARHVGEVSKELGIECEWRILPGYYISQYTKSDPSHEKDIEDIKEETNAAVEAGLKAHFAPGYAIKGWDGKVDQRDAAIYSEQATFHPTKYCNGILKWLKQQPNFSCYIHTRVMEVKEEGIQILGIGSKSVKVTTENGKEIQAKHAVEATCVPLQKLAVIVQMEFFRTYCIAVKIPKNYVEDCLINDSGDPYIYVRMTECDSQHEYMIVGGEDHKVGQEDPRGRFEALEKWTRDRFSKAGSVDYKWSGQVFVPVDTMAYIGKNQGNDNIYIVTGDGGNGLTHGVLAGKVLADEIEGIDNPWSSLYSPKRGLSVLKSLPSMIAHDVQINSQYKRFLESDIHDIEDLAPGEGGILNKRPTESGAGSFAPVAVYKDEGGKVHAMSALCPHLKAVVCWNGVEKSWDCPVHGSRFAALGTCVMGPSKAGLSKIELEEIGPGATEAR